MFPGSSSRAPTSLDHNMIIAHTSCTTGDCGGRIFHSMLSAHDGWEKILKDKMLLIKSSIFPARRWSFVFEEVEMNSATHRRQPSPLVDFFSDDVDLQ